MAQPGYTTFGTWQTGYCDQDVDSSGLRPKEQRQLIAALGGAPSGDFLLEAELVPDSAAPAVVTVFVSNIPVGRLPAATAGEYAAVLVPQAAAGRILEVPARVWWGVGGASGVGVRLDLPRPLLLLPTNPPPPEPTVFLPRKAQFEVEEVQENLATVAPLVAAQAEALMHVSLHLVGPDSSGTGDLPVEVRYNGQRLGYLSGIDADGVRGILAVIDDTPITAFCMAVVQAGTPAPRVYVQAVRTEQMPQQWLDQLIARAVEARGEQDSVVPGAEALYGQPAGAGWFADPDNPLQLRYWDGRRWTGHVHHG